MSILQLCPTRSPSPFAPYFLTEPFSRPPFRNDPSLAKSLKSGRGPYAPGWFREAAAGGAPRICVYKAARISACCVAPHGQRNACGPDVICSREPLLQRLPTSPSRAL